MAKYRTTEDKRKIILYLLQTKPNPRDRVFELTDEQILEPNMLGAIGRYEPFWLAIDEYIGKPLNVRKTCILWNRLAEAYCNGRRLHS